MLEAASKSTLFRTVIICNSGLAGTQLGPFPHRHLILRYPPRGINLWRCDEEEEMADYFFPWRTLLDHGKPALLPSASLAWLPKTLEMGEYPPKGANGGVGVGVLTERWEGAHWGVSTSRCRSRCQGADDHPKQGVDTKLKLGWGGNKW